MLPNLNVPRESGTIMRKTYVQVKKSLTNMKNTWRQNDKFIFDELRGQENYRGIIILSECVGKLEIGENYMKEEERVKRKASTSSLQTKKGGVMENLLMYVTDFSKTFVHQMDSWQKT